ncbi:MAG: hypothetical protein AAF902_11510 [Chloroflexota bacterium]
MADFLKPSLFKINLAIVLLIVGGYIVWPLIIGLTGADLILLGFPMATRTLDFSAAGTQTPIDFGNWEQVNFLAVAADVIVWYLASCAYVQRFGERDLESSRE